MNGSHISVIHTLFFGVMRVISGALKGRKLFVPKGRTIRPTSDHVKETLFNIIGPDIVQATFLDVFAGCGSIGIEALSRQAAQAVFVEKAPAHIRALRRNLAACSIETRDQVYCGDANKALSILQKAEWRFDLIYVDPPYRQTNMLRDILEKIVDLALLADTGRLIAEHSHTFAPRSTIGKNLTLEQRRRIGDTTLSFYRPV